jgi:hypothetical protein
MAASHRHRSADARSSRAQQPSAECTAPCSSSAFAACGSSDAAKNAPVTHLAADCLARHSQLAIVAAWRAILFRLSRIGREACLSAVACNATAQLNRTFSEHPRSARDMAAGGSLSPKFSEACRHANPSPIWHDSSQSPTHSLAVFGSGEGAQSRPSGRILVKGGSGAAGLAHATSNENRREADRCLTMAQSIRIAR